MDRNTVRLKGIIDLQDSMDRKSFRSTSMTLLYRNVIWTSNRKATSRKRMVIFRPA